MRANSLLLAHEEQKIIQLENNIIFFIYWLSIRNAIRTK